MLVELSPGNSPGASFLGVAVNSREFKETSGTGKFKGIHGTLGGVTDTDFKNLAGTVTEGEYWIER